MMHRFVAPRGDWRLLVATSVLFLVAYALSLAAVLGLAR